ncbi:hypothetical protein QCA50_020619 [Cerrena zonata]|uniref:Uncharacterized protein n=1 Tax=Cerrena zonata TaxID=2478898 RepID=A0AAW0F959_9APHY
MQNIRIALIGGVGSGKCSLKQALERDSFVRREDHGKFSFQANVFSTAPANLSLDYDMTLVLFGLMEQYSPDLRQNLEAAVDLASELQTMYKINERVSLVATKYDLVPRQWSGVDLYLAREENQLVYPDDISLHKVSSITREGIDDLREPTLVRKQQLAFVYKCIYPSSERCLSDPPGSRTNAGNLKICTYSIT